MSELPTAGTYRLDGMLQGPIPPDDDLRNAFQSWVETAKSAGLVFHLSLEGGSYSLVADSKLQKTSRIKDKDLEDFISGGLNSLLKLLPPPVRTKSFSTIRSEEFRPGCVAQTLYSVGSDGSLSPEQRIQDIDTEDAIPEVTPASLRRALLPSIIALLLILFISTFFINYRKLFVDARDRIAPLKKEELVLEQSSLGNLIEIKLSEIDRKHSALIFLIDRGDGWQRVESTKPGDAPDLTWQEFSAILAIHQGRVRVDFLNKENKILASREVDLRALHKDDSIKVPVVIDPKDRIAKVIFRP